MNGDLLQRLMILASFCQNLHAAIDPRSALRSGRFFTRDEMHER
jgi:hypothetical protein